MRIGEGKLVHGFWIAILILVIVTIVFYQNTVKVIETRGEEARAQEILGKLDEILFHVSDAESAQRGFILTGDDIFLEPYQAITGHMAEDVKELRTLLAGAPDQQRRVDVLEALVAEKFALLRERIELRKKEGFEPAMQSVKSGKGMKLMDDIRKAALEIENEERALLARQIEEAKSDARKTVIMFIIGSFLTFGLIFLIFSSLAREIAQRRQAEEQLQESEKKFRNLVESVPVGISVSTPEGEVIEVNPTILKLFGHSKEEFEKLPASTFYYDQKDRERFVEELLKKGRVADFEVRFKRKDGSVFWGSITTTAQKTAYGKTLFLNAVMDITERRRAEERLRAASLYTRSLIEVSPDPLVTISSDGKITDVNKATEQATGVQREQLIGADFSDYFTEPEKAREGYKQVFSQGFVKDYPLAIRHISGKVTDVLYNASVFRNEAGEVAGVFAAARDITEHKKAEESLRRSEASLAYAQKIAHIGHWDWDIVNGKLFWSDEIYRIFGLKPKEFGATYEAFLSYVHPHDREFVKKAVNEALYSKKPYSIDHRILQPDGNERFVHEDGEVDFDEKGKPIRMFGTVHDITERDHREREIRRLNEELAQSVNQLKEANKELEAFSYSVSHDLRAPLRAVDGFTNVLLEDFADRLDEEGKRVLNIIRDNTKKMGELIDSLLSLSRMGRKEMVLSKVDIGELAKSVFEEFKATEPERKLEFNLKSLPSCFADVGMMRQVFTNLLSNSIKFTRPRDVAVIEVGGYIEKNENVYYVKDNGVGFDMQYAGKLFGVFQRLHSDKEFEGTGVGLAIVHRIIHRHNGRVWAEGKVNEGATFYFTLPIKRG